MNSKRATRENWEIKPMPELKAMLPLKRSFSIAQYQRLSWGLVPEGTQDKWFIFLEDHWLYFHRSWTGYCIYQIHLEPVLDKYHVTETWVNCDPEQHKTKNDQLEIDLLNFVIDKLLLAG